MTVISEQFVALGKKTFELIIKIMKQMCHFRWSRRLQHIASMCIHVLIWTELMCNHFNHWRNKKYFNFLNFNWRQQWNNGASVVRRRAAPLSLPRRSAPVHASEFRFLSRRSVSRKGGRVPTRRAARWRPCRRSFQTRQTAWSPAQ